MTTTHDDPATINPAKTQPWTVKDGKVLSLEGEWWTPLELLKAVQQQIHAHPESYCQSFTVEKRDCGTVACLAGWMCMLTIGAEESFHSTVGNFLLNRQYGDLWPWLFDADWNYDTPHGQALRQATCPEERVAAADLAIEAFIAEYKLV